MKWEHDEKTKSVVFTTKTLENDYDDGQKIHTYMSSVPANGIDRYVNSWRSMFNL